MSRASGARVAALRGAVAVVALVAVAGCALRGPRPAPLRPVTAPELLDLLAARRAAVTSLRARARLRAGVASAWVREAVLVRRPDAIRIDVFSPAGLVYALGADGQVLWAYPPSERTRYEGAATPANVTRLLGAPMAVSDVVDVLLGLPPARHASAAPGVEVTPEREYLLTLPLADGAQRVWFTGDPPVVRRAEEARQGRPGLRVDFDDYQDGFPHAITIESLAHGEKLQLTYGSVEPNVAIDAQLFAPPPAPRVLPIEAAVTRPH